MTDQALRERARLVALAEAVHELRVAVEFVDDLRPVLTPEVLDDLDTIMATLDEQVAR